MKTLCRQFGLLFALVSLLLLGHNASAATPTPTPAAGSMISSEGVSGDIDLKRREPVLSVSVSAGLTAATIYADAYVENDGTSKYPIKFDFYINRSLFASQIRSSELPGAVGITVPYSAAPLPFNYSVLAQVITPNRIFSTVLNGAVERVDPTPAPTLTSRLDCSFTDNSLSPSVTYTAEDAQFMESGSSVSAAFDVVDAEENNLSLQLAASENSSSLSGTLTISNSDGSWTKDISGSFQKAEGLLTAISLSSSDNKERLECN